MGRSSTWLCLGPLVLLLPALAGAQQQSGPTVQAFMFGDVRFEARDGTNDDAFRLGQMVAHANAVLSDRVVFFGELSITARNSGYSLAMERAVLRYEIDDALKIGAGRFHTPISYWNTEFHHGLWLQGSVARPEAIRFGSRFVPVHFVGAIAEGSFRGSPIHYAVGFGNGRGANIAGAGDGGDLNGDRALLASVSVRPASLFGARIGGGLYLDRVTQAGFEADERIASVHAVWNRGRVDAIAEYLHVRHEEVGTSTSTGSSAVYVHLGYRLGGDFSELTPYVRWEDMSIDAADVVFVGLLDDYQALVGGVRYDFDSYAALKAEYRRETVGPTADTHGFFFQASFAIPIAGGGA